MWNSVIDSLLPVVLLILLGAALRRYGFMPDLFFHGLNKMAFWIGLPATLYLDIAGAQSQGGSALRVSGVILIASAFAGLVAWGTAAGLRLPPASLRSFIQGTFRGNLAYVGIPVVYYALRDNPEARSMAVLAMAPTVPVFNVAAVLVLTPPGEGDRLRSAGRTLQAICRNPLIISCVLGLIAQNRGFVLPLSLNTTLKTIGGIGLPAALLALGASLSLKRVRGRWPATMAAATIKVALSPLVGYAAGRAMGLSEINLLVAVLYAAMPTAVASYVMADQMEADGDLAAAIIVASTMMAFPVLAVILRLAV